MRPSKLESGIFKFSSIFAKIGSVLAIFLLVISLLMIPYIGSKDTDVTYLEVKQALNPPPVASPEALVNEAPNLKIPENVSQYMAGDNQPIFLSWIKSIDPSQQQEFTDNLSEIIEEAEQDSAVVIDTINKYRILKQAKLSSSDIEKYVSKIAKAGVFLFAFGLAILVVLMSLVLVLLAIEKNTRNIKDE